MFIMNTVSQCQIWEFAAFSLFYIIARFILWGVWGCFHCLDTLQIKHLVEKIGFCRMYADWKPWKNRSRENNLTTGDCVFIFSTAPHDLPENKFICSTQTSSQHYQEVLKVLRKRGFGHLRFHGNWANLIRWETSRDAIESSETAQSGDAFSRHTSVASVAVFILFASCISDVMQFYCQLYLHLLPLAQNNKFTLVACVLDFYYIL